jgi:post-segregation antitoxin (ccd killing protein)
MSSRLVNVRLDEEHLRKARALRESGVALSDLVRDAIDARFASLRKSPSASSVRAIMENIAEQYPEPPELQARTYDVHDRRAAQAAIARKLKARRS